MHSQNTLLHVFNRKFVAVSFLLVILTQVEIGMLVRRRNLSR